jgi:hypothetical protein
MYFNKEVLIHCVLSASHLINLLITEIELQTNGTPGTVTILILKSCEIEGKWVFSTNFSNFKEVLKLLRSKQWTQVEAPAELLLYINLKGYLFYWTLNSVFDTWRTELLVLKFNKEFMQYISWNKFLLQKRVFF